MHDNYFMFCYGILLLLIVFMFFIKYLIEFNKNKLIFKLLRLLLNIFFWISVMFSLFSWFYCLSKIGLQNINIIQYCFLLLLTALIHVIIWIYFGINVCELNDHLELK